MVQPARLFNPLGQAQQARAEGFRQGMAERNAPRVNALADIELEQAKQNQARETRKAGITEEMERIKFLNRAGKALQSAPPDQIPQAIERLEPLAQSFGIPPGTFNAETTTPESLQQLISVTDGFIQDPMAVEKQKAEIANLRADTQLKLSKSRTGPAQTLPSSITKGLTPDLQQRANDVFIASGGGEKGIKSVERLIETGLEEDRRRSVPELLQQRFPEASPAESRQLKSVIDAAETVEKGLKEAVKLREEQRNIVKQKEYRATAVDLLDKILANPEWVDVVGGREGQETGEEWFVSDHEATAISDINQIRDILTADNLKIMTGTLTDKDIAVIANLAAGALTRTRTEERFEEGVKELRRKLLEIDIASADELEAREKPSQGFTEGQTAINPQTGERAVFRNGQWQPI